MAKTNKPIITAAPGHSFNSGAALLSASGMPLVTAGSLLSYNEVTFGFVPHGGASFYLSRLPHELGTFLALTGIPITGADVKEFNLADEVINLTKEFELNMSEDYLAMDAPIPNVALISQNYKYLPNRDYL